MVKPAGKRIAPPPKRPSTDGDTEQLILDAAHEVFLRRGTAGARMQEIADQAGVNKALLHYYFRSKERLAEAVFRRAATTLMPTVIEILASDASIEEKVKRVVVIELDVLTRAPYLPAYVISELNHDPARAKQLIPVATGGSSTEFVHRVFAKLRRQIEEAVRAGEMREIAVEQFVINLISLCIFPFAAKPMLAVMLGLEGERFQQFIERRKTELVSFFLGALRP
jgi:TetR/AcrR family transcriptional regulator